MCGIELHLESLIDSIHAVRSDRIAPYLEHNRHEICEHCAFLHSSICPCPMDYLSVLVVDAVEEVDHRRRLRGESTQPDSPEEITLNEIRAAYETGTGTWSGCDWPTTFGRSGLNVQGMKPEEARARADAAETAQEFEDWTLAGQWLSQIEHHAKIAEKQAAVAVFAAAEDRWQDAADAVEWAWSLEFASGRPLRRSPPYAWQHLRDLIAVGSLAQLSAAT
jgi:hypothetical protein